jgi:hypothetical protein
LTGKPKNTEKTCPSTALFTTNPTQDLTRARNRAATEQWPVIRNNITILSEPRTGRREVKRVSLLRGCSEILHRITASHFLISGAALYHQRWREAARVTDKLTCARIDGTQRHAQAQHGVFVNWLQ